MQSLDRPAAAAHDEAAMLPIDSLPRLTQTYIEEVARQLQCPRDFVTAAALATASTAIGNKVRVRTGAYTNPLVLWFVLAARSGSNKTYPVKFITDPLRRLDEKLYADFTAEHHQWSKLPVNQRTAEPRCPGIVVDDCTDERRSEILYLNSVSGDGTRGAIGIYPELKGMFDAKNQYNNSGSAGISKLLRLFDGESVKVDRKNGFTMLIRKPFFNIIGDIQTGMLRDTFGSRMFMTNGLNQRFLFCIIDEVDFPHRASCDITERDRQLWAELIESLYTGYATHPVSKVTYPIIEQPFDGDLTLNDEAEQLYTEFYNSMQDAKLACETDYESSVYSKLQIHVLRLAGVVHMLHLAESIVKAPRAHVIGRVEMDYAIRCMDYFREMAMRLYRQLTDDGDDSGKSLSAPTTLSSKAALIRAYHKENPQLTHAQIAEEFKCSRQYVSKVL